MGLQPYCDATVYMSLYLRNSDPWSARLWVGRMACNQAISLVKSLLLQKLEVLTKIQHKLEVLRLGSGKSKGLQVSRTHFVWLTEKETNPLHGVAGDIKCFHL